jgi:hypothetical protein
VAAGGRTRWSGAPIGAGFARFEWIRRHERAASSCDCADQCVERAESGDHGLVTGRCTKPQSSMKPASELERCRKLRQFDGLEPGT